ncbi:MAG: rhodanese-like domain-containing protein, partial [Lachnospiraceae bacterium]
EDGLLVTLDNGSLETDMIILAIGVKPEGQLAEGAELTMSQRGSIAVNEHMCTSDPDIYAAGDAVEVTDFITSQKVQIPLAGPANKQGRIVADNISGIKSSYTGTQGSAILKIFEITVATTGINEKTAKRLGIPYEKMFTYSASHASYYPDAENMSVKTLFDPITGKILGAQIIGREGTDKRCDVIATAIRFNATARDLTKLELCYAPPYSSAKDPVNMVGFAIENILNGQVQQFHWHDVEKLPKDGSVILLDTRTKTEYDRGHIDGFINIPLDNLRERLSELTKDKPIYVTCQVGLRGYIACRILTQNGFNCYNLSGGYQVYHSIFYNKR